MWSMFCNWDKQSTYHCRSVVVFGCLLFQPVACSSFWVNHVGNRTSFSSSSEALCLQQCLEGRKRSVGNPWYGKKRKVLKVIKKIERKAKWAGVIKGLAPCRSSNLTCKLQNSEKALLSISTAKKNDTKHWVSTLSSLCLYHHSIVKATEKLKKEDKEGVGNMQKWAALENRKALSRCFKLQHVAQ